MSMCFGTMDATVTMPKLRDNREEDLTFVNKAFGNWVFYCSLHVLSV